MESVVLEYPTHILTLNNVVNGFVKASNIVKDEVYKGMIKALLEKNRDTENFYFVGEERKILNNFLKSLVGFNNIKDNILMGTPIMYSFTDDLEYQVFCLTNDLPYREQECFKTIYVKTSFLNSISYFKQASTLLVKNLYPEHFSLPDNLLEKIFKKFKEKSNSIKCEFDKIEKFLKEKDIYCLYHFTDKRNLPSIKIKGILSNHKLEELGIKVSYSSSDSSRLIDKSKYLGNYVHLGYEPQHPMLFYALSEGRLYEYAILRISPEVIILKSTKFSNINAASSNALISDDINFFLGLNFHLFHNQNYFNLSPENKKLFQAEVLVENQVSPSTILNINLI